MSCTAVDRMPTVPHGTLVYDNKANARCFNSHGLVKCTQPGRSYWINENGEVSEVIAGTGGVLKYKNAKPQTAPPFAPSLCPTG